MMKAEEVNSFAEQNQKIHDRFFDVLDNSMDNETSKAICIGDILNCREIKQWDKIHDLNNLKYPVVVVTSDGNKVGRITGHEAGMIILHKYNPAHKDLRIPCSKVETIYLAWSIQRNMTP